MCNALAPWRTEIGTLATRTQQQMTAETTPAQAKENLVRLFGGAGFDPARDIGGIVLNRWGHAYVCPAPGFYFGKPGETAPSDVIRQPLGRVTFANAELNGHQSWVHATAEGRRAVEQLLAAG